MSDIGKIIKSRRLDKKLTLSELGQKLSLTPGYLSNIENNKRTPSKEVLSKISFELNLDMGELFFIAGYWNLSQKKTDEFTFFDFDKLDSENFISKLGKRKHLKIEELLKEDRNFYINNSLIPKKEIDRLIEVIEVLYDRKTNDYPTFDEFKKEFNKE